MADAIPSPMAEKQSTRELQKSINLDKFQIVQKSLMVDVDMHVLFDQQFANWERIVYWKKLSWQQAQHKNCVDAAEEFFNKNTKWLVTSDLAQTIRDFRALQDEVKAQHCPILAYVNWSAPCAQSSAETTIVTSILGYLGTETEKFLGAVIQPVFTWQPGTLWREEGMLVKALSMQNLNVDKQHHDIQHGGN